MKRVAAATYELFGHLENDRESLREFNAYSREEAESLARAWILAKRFTNFEGFSVVEKRLVAEFSLKEVLKEEKRKELCHER